MRRRVSLSNMSRVWQNAGNQAAVLVIRGLATGEITTRSQLRYIWGEVKMALAISMCMTIAGYIRVRLFDYSMRDAIAIATSLFLIVISSVVIGTLLPLLLHRLHLDPAHAGATIQVIMDLMGVCISCFVCSILLVEAPDDHHPLRSPSHN